MNNLYFALLLAATTQFFGSTETLPFLQKTNPVLKDSIPFVCGQAEGYEAFFKQNPEVLKKQNQWEAAQKVRIESGQSTARRGTAYEIPVVVHIIHDNGSENISDASVAQGIQYLNDGMAATGAYGGVGGTDTELTFRLAERDPDNNVTTGINRVVSPLTEMLKSEDLDVKNLIRWDPTCYVNFWLVREICKPGGNCGVAGYAYFPSSHGRDEDGIVMEARHFADSPESAIVQIHEIGHYLGLYHTFQDGCKNDDCLVDGDRVCDTPPDQSTARVNCADGANSCSTDINPSDPNNPFITDENDQMENFMDYASCSVLFTEGQKVRMVDALENVRFSLIDTDRCPVFCSSPVTANFSASTTDIFAGETVTFSDLSAGAVSSIWTIDGVPFSGTSFTFNTVGSFIVRLQIIGTDPACRDNFSLSITVKCPVEADFATSTTQVALNETVNFTNSSTGATIYEWTVNNSVESSAANFDFSSPAPGIYTICLTAENGICQSKKCQRILVTSGGGTPPCTGPNCEDCSNGIDDNGDGLIDFFDPDCPCIPTNGCGAPFYSPCREICDETEPLDSFLFDVNYTGIETNSNGVINAADYDGDCEPEVCLRLPNRTIGVIGQSGLEYTYSVDDDHSLFGIASADVDNDGAAEIFMIVENYRTDLYFIWRLDYNFARNRLEKTWEASQPFDLEGHDVHLHRMIPSIADFNFDGRPEIYLGNQIFDSQTGQFLGSPGAGFNTGSAEATDGDKTGIYTTSIAVDALPDNACADCTGLELVAGNQVLSVSLNSTTNPGANFIKVAVELPGFEDGVTAIADFDLDGDLDIIVANLNGIVEVGKLYIWDGQTPTQIGQSIEQDFSDFLGMSTPAIGDLDGDGHPEIVVNSGDVISFDDYQSGGGTAWGSDPAKTVIGSRYLRDHQVGMTLFDFNLDGKQEIVIRNQWGFHILDEKINTIGEIKEFQGASALPETPIIIDWDDDGEAEILTFGCKGSIQGPVFCQAEFIVINSASFKWANTRKLQNQFAYFNTNINDDGTIPTQQQSPHLLKNPALNSFNQQYAMPAPLGAEAFAEIEDSRCGTNGIEIDFKICNDGEESLPANIPVAIYDGNPTRINAPLLLTFELSDVLFPSECITLSDTFSVSQDSVFVVVNDDGTLPRPFNLTNPFPPTNIRECNYSNNISGIEVPKGNSPLLDLGPDILICDNGIFPLDAGAGFATYRWSDESFERSITVYEPGKYWVETTDICRAIQTDTIVIEIDPLTEVKLGTDLTVCIGDTIQFDAGIFDNYKWLPKSAVDCDTCQIFNLKISQDTQIIVQVQSGLGCISLDTVDVSVTAIPIGFDSIFICRGDTISVNGTAISSDTLLSQNINSLSGCDSILNTKIVVNDTIVQNQIIEICEGDTVTVFGNPITKNALLIRAYSRANNCDSTHRVQVKVKPKLFESDELQFCEGDTAMIFGNIVTKNDTLSQVSTSSIGCDSTSEIRVIFTNSINTQDDLDLCAGDTAIVFGNVITSDSTLFENYNSSNGCDSIHEVQVKFRPRLSGSETLEFCEGDTVMIFGNTVIKSDTIFEVLTASNGCDSLAIVEVFFNQKTNSDEVLEFCEGDTAIIFGIEILKDSIISQTLVGFNGCDSTHSVEVIFNQKIQTEDSLQICAGDTVFVFGNPIMSDSIVSQIYSSNNSCDSTSQIKISVRPTLKTDDEIQFCEGDTAMIFGTVVTENDTLSQVFTSAIGCDSTSEIRAIFTNSINTDEDLDLCAGDTIMIFGNEITSDSILFETYNSTAGCDSTHEIRVKFRPAISGGEMLVFCEGDTAMIFGNQVTESDTISEILMAADGCDSLTTIEIIFNQKSTSSEVLEFCQGDTARFFGLEILTDSIVSQTLPNLNGCDSTHSIELIFNQKFETFEQLEFCVGDTAFLFGNALTKDSMVAEIYASAIGCDSTHNIDVIFLAEAEKMIFDSLCTGNFLLFFNDTISETGTYFQTVSAIADGCDTNYVLTAEFFEDPIVELISDTLISVGETFEIPLNISDSTLQVTWQSNENLSCGNCPNPTVSLTEETSFEATITNPRGCSVIARINIRVIGETGIYIPTGFSPNGDLNNDFFTVFSKNPRPIDQLQIFDRWGGLLFELNDFMSNDPTIGWDGTARGLPVNSAVFIYKILFRNDANEQKMLAGDVTVIR